MRRCVAVPVVCLVTLMTAFASVGAAAKESFVPPPWGETAQKHVAQWLFEPYVEDGIGITRVGVTVALIAVPQKECDKMPPRPGVNFEVRACWSR